MTREQRNSRRVRYFYDADAIAEQASGRASGAVSIDKTGGEGKFRTRAGFAADGKNAHEQRNKRDVWTIASQPFAGSHFATMPPDLAKPCVMAGSRVGDLVLDPFFGSGTTGMVAETLGRRWIGFDLNPANGADGDAVVMRLPVIRWAVG